MLNDSGKKAKTSFIQDIFLSAYKKKMLRAGFELSVKQKENEKHTLMNWKDRGSGTNKTIFVQENRQKNNK